MLKFFGSSDIKIRVRNYFESLKDLEGKIVVDLPAGSGYMSAVAKRKGADVYAYDLFPEFFSAEGLACQKANLSKELPIETEFADYVIFQEGIEHLPDPYFALKELNRVLKKRGTLIVTTPNISSLRAKLSNLFVESEIYQRFPANELDAVWFSGDKERYFGHIFLIGVQRLRVLARLAGFRLRKVHPVKASTSSLFLGILYPFILIINLYAFIATSRKLGGVNRDIKGPVLKEILLLNLSPSVLFGKHLFLEFEKEMDSGNVVVGCSKAKDTIY